MPSFTRLVRFLATDGKTYYGDAVLPRGVSDLAHAKQARIITGDIFGQHHVTSTVAEVTSLLAPLAPADVTTVRCLGLNYAKHAQETNMAVPKYPILFYKPATALTGPTSPIPVPLVAQEAPGLDYECELVIVIGRRARDVAPADAPRHVLGYAVGNDVSHRAWQLERGGGQWSLGKGFDGWAPYGPGIVAAHVLPGGTPEGLRIGTRVNGEARQESDTGDLIFGVADTVAFLSRGTTLLPGDLIFTGTPAGVAMGRSPQPWLRDGDVVEVSLEGVGTCANKVEFEQEKARL